MYRKPTLYSTTALSLGAALLFGTPVLAEVESVDAPFTLDFGTAETQDGGEGLLQTPSEDAFLLQDDSLRYRPLSDDFVSSSAMAQVGNYIERQDFVLESEMTLAALPQVGENRVGFAVLGGPHDPDDAPFDTADDQGFYGVMWLPAVDGETSELRIREGFSGSDLAVETWEGRHPNAGDTGEGVGEAYEVEVEGEFDDTGVLVLTFTLTDQAGHSQSVSAVISEPFDGDLFGLGGNIASGPDGPPEFDFHDLSMEIGEEPGPVVEDPTIGRPFRLVFGSDDGRDSGEDFAKNVEDDWSLIPEALRLSTGAGSFHNSLATSRVLNFEPGEDFFLESRITLTNLEGPESASRVGLVLFGDSDREVFDPDDDGTFHTAQWIPNDGGTSSLVVREGMNGAEVARVDWEETDGFPAFPSAEEPEAGIGDSYRIEFRGTYGDGGELEFKAVLTDERGGWAAASGVIQDPPEGNRFGFGARHRGEENPGWEFHSLTWTNDAWKVDYEPLEAPFTLDFGTGGEQTGLGPLLLAGRPQDWGEEGDAVRFASVAGSPDDPGLSWTNSTGVVAVENYRPGQDFFLEADVTQVRYGGGDWERFGFLALGGPHSLEEPLSPGEGFYKMLLMRGQLRLNDQPGGIIVREDWEGAYRDDPISFHIEASGVYDELGRLELSYTFTDDQGHSQTLSTVIDNPVYDGNLFGFFFRDRYDDASPPAYDIENFSVTLGEEPDPEEQDPVVGWPFDYAFGTDVGRDDDADFMRNISGDWSLEPTALRLSTSIDIAHNSLNTTRVGNFEPGDDFALRSRMTLSDLTGGQTAARAGLVLFGDEEGFDAEDDATFYTFQLLPNPAGEPSIAVRQGMDGAIVAETSFDEPDNPPDTQPGTTYTLEFRGFSEEDDLRFLAVLTDENGGSATVSGVIDETLDGKNRFGVGARHAEADEAVWDFHEFSMFDAWKVDYEPLEAPFTLDFGTGEGQTGLGPLLLAERPQDWGEEDDAVRFASIAGSPDDPGLSWTNSTGVVVVENYQPGQDFFLEADVTQVRYGGGDWERFGFLALGGPHSLEDPLSPGEGFYKMLLMRGQLRLNDQPGGIIVREDWEGAFRDDPITFHIEASGVYDEAGNLELSYTFTDDGGHSQTLSTVIEDPAYDGNVFGFFFRDRYDDTSPPAYDIQNFSMTLGEPPEPEGPTFAAWQEEHFTEAERDDPEIGGPEAAPAGDGVANLLKYAFGLDPFAPVSLADLVESEVTEGILRLTYLERVDAQDIEYVPEVSTNLSDWDGGPGHVEEVEVEPVAGGEFNEVTVQAVLDEDEERAFLRVKVIRN